MWDATTGENTLTLTTEPVRGSTWSSDGTRILTTGPHGTRQWDAETGQPVGVIIEPLPEGEVVVRDAVTEEVLGASPEAWRWLGYAATVDGQMTRLPAELYGPLPPLKQAGS